MWFTNKAEKEKRLFANQIANLNDLNTSHADIIGSYCKINRYFFKFLGFDIQDNVIIIKFKDKGTIDGYITTSPLDLFYLRHDMNNLHKARYEFDQFKDELHRIGLRLEAIK